MRLSAKGNLVCEYLIDATPRLELGLTDGLVGVRTDGPAKVLYADQ